MRPCKCDKPDCPLCSRYHGDERYRALWDGFEQPKAGLGEWLGAMAKETAWRAGGRPGPTTAEKEHRRRVCNTCALRDASNDSCTKCGCYLEAGLLPPRPLGKLDCATQRCPLGMWDYAGGYVSPGCGTCGSKR